MSTSVQFNGLSRDVADARPQSDKRRCRRSRRRWIRDDDSMTGHSDYTINEHSFIINATQNYSETTNLRRGSLSRNFLQLQFLQLPISHIGKNFVQKLKLLDPDWNCKWDIRLIKNKLQEFVENFLSYEQNSYKLLLSRNDENSYKKFPDLLRDPGHHENIIAIVTRDTPPLIQSEFVHNFFWVILLTDKQTKAKT